MWIGTWCCTWCTVLGKSCVEWQRNMLSFCYCLLVYCTPYLGFVGRPSGWEAEAWWPECNDSAQTDSRVCEVFTKTLWRILGSAVVWGNPLSPALRDTGGRPPRWTQGLRMSVNEGHFHTLPSITNKQANIDNVMYARPFQCMWSATP